MTWETVIGLETHVELATRTKIFCACTTEFGGAPNTHCCPVCTGMPGALPVMNEKVLEFAVKAGLALHCEITRYSKFDRKNYFYPDLPKAYQVSQLYLPIARNGAVPIKTGKTIRIHELHMEASWSTTPGSTRRGQTTTAAASPSLRSSPSPTSALGRRSSPIWKSCAPPSSIWGFPTARCRRALSAAM